MTKTVSQNQELNSLVRKTIIETIQEVLMDPDYDLELQKWVKERLKKRPRAFVPFEEIKRKYG